MTEEEQPQPLPPYFYPAPAAERILHSAPDVADFVGPIMVSAPQGDGWEYRVHQEFEETARLSDEHKKLILRGAKERVFRWADGAWHEDVPEHEHDWATRVISVRIADFRVWKYANTLPRIDERDVFCAYPHCAARP